MTPEKLFGDILNLGKSWEIRNVDYNSPGNKVYLVVGETKHLWEQEKCGKDGGSVSCYDHVEAREWRHLNVFNKECVIICSLPRGKCSVCGQIYRVTPPWEGQSKHFSKEFEAFALTLMREMPVKKVGEIMGETDKRLWRMLIAHVEVAYGKLAMDDVYCVGVDEMSRAKGQRYVTVFADLVKRRVLFATPGKDAATWGEFIKALEAHNGHRHAITQVSMDMSPAYQSGVKEHCRNAAIVFDKYHVIAQLNKAVDDVRTLEQRRGDAAVRKQLHKSAWLWRKNPHNLTPNEQIRMKRIDHSMLVTSKAYQMRLALQEIYAIPYRSHAKRRFLSWCKWVRREVKKSKWTMLEAMGKAAQMIESHLEGILAHWLDGITNAYMEGLNSVFSAVRRKARGYRSCTYLITMLYFVAAKLSIPNPSFH